MDSSKVSYTGNESREDSQRKENMRFPPAIPSNASNMIDSSSFMSRTSQKSQESIGSTHSAKSDSFIPAWRRKLREKIEMTRVKLLMRQEAEVI